jgi:hypothetical protein
LKPPPAVKATGRGSTRGGRITARLLAGEELGATVNRNGDHGDRNNRGLVVVLLLLPLLLTQLSGEQRLLLEVVLLNRSDERNRRGTELLIAAVELLLVSTAETEPASMSITSQTEQPDEGQESETHRITYLSIESLPGPKVLPSAGPFLRATTFRLWASCRL